MPFPQLKDYVGELVIRLLQPALDKTFAQKVRVLVKNLTFRDQGLESELTKHLSGLIKAELKGLGEIELLSPSDVSETPQAVLLGEVWNTEDRIDVRLRLTEGRSRRELSAGALGIGKDQVPPDKDITPHEQESLDTIQRVIALMNRVLPVGGDFQLGVWPDKGADAVYWEDEKLIVNLKPEKTCYLHVDYYTVNGNVVHLLPNHFEGGSGFAEKDEQLTIGGPESELEFTISAPFGEELLVVIASDKPITARPWKLSQLTEPAEPYVKKFTQSLLRQKSKGKMAGAHLIVITKERDSEG
jgi:hypothetical protein